MTERAGIPAKNGGASDVHPVFRGAVGRLGPDLSAVEWPVTPLGSPDTWPQSLRTVLATMLTSRFSMWMAWGPDLTFFCNDAYRSDTLGRKYPWALGRSAREVWEEIWPDIGPRIDRVIATGDATWDEGLLLFLERSGFVEESYHTFSYSPLRDEHDTVVGMLCVVSEDTARVVGERRLATLRDLGADPTALRSEKEAWAFAARCFGANLRTFPFALFYRFEEDGTACLEAASGLDARSPLAPNAPMAPIAPEVIDPADPSGPWPTVGVHKGSVETVAIDEHEGALPTGAWTEPPREALIVPLAQQGSAPFGFVAAGLNRYRPLDANYRSFVGLAARQVSAGISSARLNELEHRRAEALAELDAAKTAFFTNVSHELRTPLTLILGPTEVALADGAEPLSAVQRARVDMVRRNAQRLLQLVNAQLDFSRLSSGRAELVPEPTDVATYTAELAETFRWAAERAGLSLVVDCASLSGAVELDREMWAKIVCNLLSNALKFTFSGEIRVTLARDGGDLVLAVADTGVGIERHELPKLFQRFHRVAGTRARSNEGSGMGLALIAELVRLHGGNVAVESEVGRGTTFAVQVPYRPADPGAPGAPGAVGAANAQFGAGEYARGLLIGATRWLGLAAPADAAGEGGRVGTGRQLGVGPSAVATAGVVGSPDATEGVVGSPDAGHRGERPRVLVVDDNADMREHIRALLHDDYDVELAVDGADALIRAQARPPDLVLTDVMMPNLDGFGLLRAMRADAVLYTVPVVVVSARAGEEASIEGLEAGADDYLVKPFSARELRVRVRANLELDRARRHRAELQHSHDLLEQAERLARVGSWEIDVDGKGARVSDQYLAITGLSREEVEPLDLPGFIESLVYPTDRSRVTRVISNALEGAPLRFETTLVRPDGESRTVVVTGERARDPDGERHLRGAVQDVTEWRATERALAERSRELVLLTAQLEALAGVLARRPLADVLRELLLAIERASSNGLLGSVLLADADGRHLHHCAAPSLPNAYNRAIDGIEIGPHNGSCGTAAYRRAQVVTEDIETDPNWEPYRDLAHAAGLRACWSTPLLGPGGRLLGTFAMYYQRPHRPSEADLGLATVLGRSVSLIIRRAQLDEARERELATERAAAVTLQHSLLPVIPPSIGAVRLACSYNTGDPDVEVGGDWYDAFEVPSGVMLMIGDVQGHDLRAATVMGQLRTLARDYVRDLLSPAEILSRLDRYLRELGTDLLATVAVAHLFVETGTVMAASAGHVPPLVFEPHEDGVRTSELALDTGPPLGLGGPWKERTSELASGATVLLYTDGLVESRTRGIDEGIASLRDVLRSLPRDVGAAALLDAVLDLVPEGSRRDDVAVLAATVPMRARGQVATCR